MDLDALLDGLDADQRLAVTIDAAPLAIIAAAGSGKTSVLTRRIAHRVAVDPGVQAQHVLALTFTSQAAQELQRRLRRAGMRDRVEAGTFHAIALRLLRQRAIDAGHRPPVVASDRRRLAAEALRSIGADDVPDFILSDLDWCRARRVPFEHFSDAARRTGGRTSGSSSKLIRFADAYATVKKRRGVVDFDDLLEECLAAMRSDKLWSAGVRWRFRHFFVDEAQDLNPLQHAVLESIRNGRPDVCLVGDPRQAIFGFNGADPAIMNGIETLYPGVTIVRLRNNYRCSPEVVEAARAVLHHADQHDDSVAVAPPGPDVRVLAVADESVETAEAAHLLRELVGVNGAWRTCAVLARTLNQLSAVGRSLERAGIPTVTRGRTSTSTALGAALAEAASQRNPSDLATWIDSVNAEEGTNPLRARVAEAADRYLSQGATVSFRAWVDLYAPFDDLQDDSGDGVELQTFHGAKGREWRSVLIVGAEVGLIPHSSAVTAAMRDEEARLLYVACTRAREALVITWAQVRNDRPTKMSPLVAGIGAGGSNSPAPPPARRPPRAKPDPVYSALVSWRKNAAKAAKVDPASICSDESLRAVAQARPSTVEAVAALTDLGPIAAARIAPRILAALNDAL